MCLKHTCVVIVEDVIKRAKVLAVLLKAIWSHGHRLELSGHCLDSGTIRTPSVTVRLQSGAVWTRIRVVCHANECRSTVLHAVGLLTAFFV